MEVTVAGVSLSE